MKTPQVSKLHTLTGHNNSIYTLESGLTPAQFLSGAGDGMVALWDLQNAENGRLVAQVPNSIYALHTDVPNSCLYVGHNYEGVHLVDLQAFKEIGSAKVTDSAIFDIKKHENKLFVGTGDGTLIYMQADDLSVNTKVRFSEKSLRTIAINPHLGHIALGFSDHCIRIIDLHSLQLIVSIQAHASSVFTLHYAPDGKRLLSAGRDARLKSWDVTKGYELVKEVVAHMYAINHIAYRPDGRYFATCSMDKSIKVWDANSLQLLKVIDKARHAGHGTSVNKLYWSDYEQQLVSCSDDRSISVWQVGLDEFYQN
jgi:WD repeat-containing protein 61